MQAARWRILQSKLTQHGPSGLRFHPEIAAFQQVSDPLEELTKRFRKHGLHVFVAAKEDDLANAAAGPRVEIETNMINNPARIRAPTKDPPISTLRLVRLITDIQPLLASV